MIEERFLESAVRIRRNFLKVNNNLEMYHRRAKEIVSNLETILEKVNSLIEEIDKGKKSGQPTHTKESALEEKMTIITDLDYQGKSLDELATPMNSEKEKLAMEEQELYRQIKEKHSDLSDEKLIEIVKDRLELEVLS